VLAQAIATTTLPDASGLPGTPLVMGTTSVPDVGLPRARQVVTLMQATARRGTPETDSGVPGTPLVMGTTTPSPVEVPPTAKHAVALGHATPLLAEIGWTTVAEAGAAPPNTAADMANANTPRSEMTLLGLSARRRRRQGITTPHSPCSENHNQFFSE